VLRDLLAMHWSNIMQALEKRIAALEQAAPAYDSTPMFIHFVGMGNKQEIQLITNGGKEWTRQPGESEQDLQDRAERETEPNPHGRRVFFCW
jgi:hypothetical protein